MLPRLVAEYDSCHVKMESQGVQPFFFGCQKSNDVQMETPISVSYGLAAARNRLRRNRALSSMSRACTTCFETRQQKSKAGVERERGSQKASCYGFVPTRAFSLLALPQQ